MLLQTNRRPSIAFLVAAFLLCSFILKDKPNVNVVFIGDSITRGAIADTSSPPKFAGEYLEKQPGIGKVQVANMGRSGFTTVNFLPGHKTFDQVKAAASAIYTDPQSSLIFSIMLGTNDSAIEGPAGAPVSPLHYRANMKLIADSLLMVYPHCKIVIHYPIWYSETTRNAGASYKKEGQERVLLYQKEIDTLVGLYKKEKPQRVFMGDQQAYGYFKRTYLTDFKHQIGPEGLYFLHPNQKGDTALGEFWAKNLMRVIR